MENPACKKNPILEPKLSSTQLFSSFWVSIKVGANSPTWFWVLEMSPFAKEQEGLAEHM